MAIAMVIFSYTGSRQVKISQKVLGGATFLNHTVYRRCTSFGVHVQQWFTCSC